MLYDPSFKAAVNVAITRDPFAAVHVQARFAGLRHNSSAGTFSPPTSCLILAARNRRKGLHPMSTWVPALTPISLRGEILLAMRWEGGECVRNIGVDCRRFGSKLEAEIGAHCPHFS